MDGTPLIATDRPEIPVGNYCYGYTGRQRVATHYIDSDGERKAFPPDSNVLVPETFYCPHHQLREDHPSQDNGYCKLLDHGDWQEEGMGLLWDSIKVCGHNPDQTDYLTEAHNAETQKSNDATRKRL